MPNDFLERNLEEIIFENSSTIHEKGLPKFYENTERQFRLIDGSLIDIFTWEIKEDVFFATIIEIKREVAKEEAFWQIMNYHDQVYHSVLGRFKDYKINNVLIATSFCRNICNAIQSSHNTWTYSYDYKMEGIQFYIASINATMMNHYHPNQERKEVFPDFYNKLIKNKGCLG